MKRMGVVGGEPLFCRRLRSLFEADGFAVECFAGPQELLEATRSRTFDALFIEIGPAFDGIDLCRRVRSEGLQSDVPIIAVTEDPSDHPDALAAGADDSVVRTLSMRELLARSRSVLRRAANGLQEEAAYADGVLKIFPETMRIISHGSQINLSRGESAVLALLIRHAPAALPVERIRSELGEQVTRSAIEARLKSLRKKIGRHLIENRTGYGYSFAARRERDR